ncbi:MAG: hypothetical protein DRI32_00540 [Chloroflexi bacterium]|nr:MAG: hypothetical protein DRI32_00540 [Chloroflexota bacterium]
MSKTKKSIFIVWKEYQRRVDVIAPYLETEHFYFYYPWEMKSKIFKAISYIPKTISTLNCLFKNKPALVFVQFPPTPALYAVAFYSWLTGVRYVSDCHIGVTNEMWMNWLFAKKILAKGEMIVHNAHLVQQVEESVKIKPFVVRDGIAKKEEVEIRESSLLDEIGLSPKKYVLFPSSFDKDEPLEEVFGAARLLPEIKFVMTWHVEKLSKEMKRSLPPNIVLTGFLEIGDFNYLFANAGVALVLTKNEGVQLSGMQEAMAFESPAVVSDLKTTRFLYKEFPVYVKNEPKSIAQGISYAFENGAELGEGMRELRVESEKEFYEQVTHLKLSLGLP